MSQIHEPDKERQFDIALGKITQFNEQIQKLNEQIFQASSTEERLDLFIKKSNLQDERSACHTELIRLIGNPYYSGVDMDIV